MYSCHIQQAVAGWLHDQLAFMKPMVLALILLKSWLANAISIVNLVCHSGFTETVSSNCYFIFCVTLLLFLTSSSSYHLPNLSYHGLFFWHIKYVGLQNLIQRNEQLYGSGNTPSGGVALPFILVQVNMFWSLWFFSLLYTIDWVNEFHILLHMI